MSANVNLPANLSNLLEIQLFSKLSAAQQKQVKSFVNRCKNLDGYETPFHWDCIENRKNPFIHEILCYVDKKLVGYVALYYFKDKEVEITLLVHPEYRDSKVFRLIWEQIKLTVHRNKIETEYYTFTLHQKNENLIELLKDAEANRVNQIYKLLLSKKPPFFDHNPALRPELTIREAMESDTDVLVELECQSFGTEATAYLDNLNALFVDPKQKIYVVLENEKIVGKVHFKIEKSHAFIFDFCIFSNKQNKGFGNFLLQDTILTVLANGVDKIYLETDSPLYLKWYKKLGFKEAAIYDHWKLYYPSFIKYHDNQYRMLVLNHYQEYDLLA
jgi:N-acetylglutamate synthase-like GNAT family acetyltransferase